MRSEGYSIARLIVLSVALLSTGPSAPKAANIIGPNLTAAPIDPQADLLYRPEVRLRKLHLVRPDLIPYPIAYEVYC